VAVADGDWSGHGHCHEDDHVCDHHRSFRLGTRLALGKAPLSEEIPVAGGWWLVAGGRLRFRRPAPVPAGPRPSRLRQNPSEPRGIPISDGPKEV
jgi:hypothetical protein